MRASALLVALVFLGAPFAAPLAAGEAAPSQDPSAPTPIGPGTTSGTLRPGEQAHYYAFEASAHDEIVFRLVGDVIAYVDGPLGGGGLWVEDGEEASMAALRDGTFVVEVWAPYRNVGGVDYEFVLALEPTYPWVQTREGPQGWHALEAAWEGPERRVVTMALEFPRTCEGTQAHQSWELFLEPPTGPGWGLRLFYGSSLGCGGVDQEVSARMLVDEHDLRVEVIERRDLTTQRERGISQVVLVIEGFALVSLRGNAVISDAPYAAIGIVGEAPARFVTDAGDGVVVWRGEDSDIVVGTPLGRLFGERRLVLDVEDRFMGNFRAGGGGLEGRHTGRATAPDGRTYENDHWLYAPQRGTWTFTLDPAFENSLSRPGVKLLGAFIPTLGVHPGR